MRVSDSEMRLLHEHGSFAEFAARMGLSPERCARAAAWDSGRIVPAGLFCQMDADELEQGQDQGMAGQESETGRSHEAAA